MKFVALLDFIVAIGLIFTVWINGNYKDSAELASVYMILKCVVFNSAIFDSLRSEKWFSKSN